MSPLAISPVMARIQTIESRFGVPIEMRMARPSAGNDFASQLAAAFADSSLLAGSTAIDADGATVASSAAPPMWNASTTLAPGTYATLTSQAPFSGMIGVSGITGASASTGAVDGTVPFAAQFETAGARHGVPPQLLAAVGWVESRYQIDAVSSAGAQGVMQLMPFVADEYGVDAFDPHQAIDAAAQLLRTHHDRFGSWDLALAAYNAGAGAVSRAGNAIPSPRVAEYVRRVNERMTA
jgi:peptidoglycan DL-endopeptidase CwlO